MDFYPSLFCLPLWVHLKPALVIGLVGLVFVQGLYVLYSTLHFCADM